MPHAVLNTLGHAPFLIPELRRHVRPARWRGPPGAGVPGRHNLGPAETGQCGHTGGDRARGGFGPAGDGGLHPSRPARPRRDPSPAAPGAGNADLVSPHGQEWLRPRHGPP